MEGHPLYNSKMTEKIQTSIEWDSNLENAVTALTSITSCVASTGTQAIQHTAGPVRHHGVFT